MAVTGQDSGGISSDVKSYIEKLTLLEIPQFIRCIDWNLFAEEAFSCGSEQVGASDHEPCDKR